MSAEGLEPSTQGLKVNLPPNKKIGETGTGLQIGVQSESTDEKNLAISDPQLRRLIQIFSQANINQREELLILAERLVHDRD